MNALPSFAIASTELHSRRGQLKAILSVLKANSRCYSDIDCPHGDCPLCFQVHAERINAFLHERQPIEFVLPAFPAKSPNRQKVLGALPDLGERLALDHLNSLCQEIAAIYSPGATITICSDGHVFADLVGLEDDTVDRYLQQLHLLIDQRHCKNLRIFSLSGVAGIDSEAGRRYLIENFAPTAEDVRQQVLTDRATTATFNGMARFVFEDLLSVEAGHGTRSSLRKRAKELTYKMMQRSISWGALVAHEFPNAVRLSVHPQSTHSNKLGIHLLPTQDDWLTPWHGVVLEVAGQFMLVKRHQLQGTDAVLQFEGPHPSHFALAGLPQSGQAKAHTH